MISAAQCCHRGPSSQAKPTDGNCRRDFDEGVLNSPGCKLNMYFKDLGFNWILPNARIGKKIFFQKV